MFKRHMALYDNFKHKEYKIKMLTDDEYGKYTFKPFLNRNNRKLSPFQQRLIDYKNKKKINHFKY